MINNFEPTPPVDALAYLRAKTLRPSWDHREVYGQEHALAFTVAKTMGYDIIDTLYNAVDQALQEGRTLAQFKKDLQPTLEFAGWWGKAETTDPITGEPQTVQLGNPRRLATIYSANLATARATGQWQRIERTQNSHPYLVYELGPSRDHRPEHQAWRGITLPANDPWWRTHMPPNGWGCKCRVRQVSRREYDRLVSTGDYLTTAPDLEMRQWVNKRTGESKQVPKGIDAGWDYNPGQARVDHLNSLLAQKQEAARNRV